MAYSRSRKSISEQSRGKPGCIALFLIVWGCGFGAGGVLALTGNMEGDASPWIGLPFLLLGGGAILGGLYILVRAKRGVDPAPKQSAPKPMSGPLRPRNRLARALFLVIFTSVWCTITFGFCFDAFGLDADVPGIIKWPFGAASIAVIALTIYTLLALTNPTPIVDFGRSELRLGREETARWQLTGNVSRIRLLRMELIGREVARYTVGTDTHEATHDFFSQTLLEEDDPAQMLHGEFDIRLPADSVPSFESDSNKVRWLITVFGDIPRWPDIKEEVVLTVGADLPEQEGNR